MQHYGGFSLPPPAVSVGSPGSGGAVGLFSAGGRGGSPAGSGGGAGSGPGGPAAASAAAAAALFGGFPAPPPGFPGSAAQHHLPPHPSLLGAALPQMPPGFNPSTLTLAERLAGKVSPFITLFFFVRSSFYH